jgi:hypothetical protein
MCAHGAPGAGIFNGRGLRDIPSRGQCLTCRVPAGHSAYGTAYGAGADHPGIEDDAQMNREWATEQLDAILGHT